MRELATLLLIVLLVYLFQCLCWAGTRGHAFSLELSGRSGRKKRGFPWSSLDLTGYWANPLPPLQPLLIVEWPAFRPGPESVSLGPEDGEPLVVSWEQLAPKRSGSKLLCNDLKVFHGSADQAREHLDFLLRVKQARPKNRAGMIESWLRHATDAKAARERLELFDGKSRWLDLAANLQFFLLFVIVPLGFFRFGGRALWPLVAVVLATSIFIAWHFLRLHKTFFPADGEARYKSVFSTILSPMYAIRAGDALARDVLAGFHPVVAAALVCSRQEFESFAGEQLRANRFSNAGPSWHADQLERALAGMLAKEGIEAARLTDAPERQEDCVVYCPRCRAQYTKTRDQCSDCGYGELLPFQKGTTAFNKKAVR